MTHSAIADLAYLEYDCAAIDGNLADLSRTLHRHAGEVPECSAAVLDVRRMRKRLRRMIDRLDAVLTAAVQAQEHLEPLPF